MSLLSVRTLVSISGSALAVLVGMLAQPLPPACADDLSDYLAVRSNAPTCIDQSLPPAKRISSCTAIIDLAAHGSSVAGTRIADIYVARATALEQNGADQAALQDLNTAEKKDPRNALPWIGLGNFYIAKSDYARALESYDHAAKIGSKDPVIYDDRGAALAALHRNDEAIADFTRALALDRRDTTALSNRATLYLDSNRSELAIADLTQLIGAEPANAQAYYHRGTAYERANELDKAMEDYRRATRLQPSFASAYEALGRVLARKDPEAALAELGKAIEVEPRSSVLRSRAILYLSLGRFEPALRDLDQVIANDGSDSIAYLDRGVAEEQLGNLEMALADYSRSIELETTAAALVDRGSVYMRLAQPHKARADFDAALVLEPNDVPALIGRADANYAPGTRDPELLAASLNDYTRVIEAAPKNAVAYLIRGNIHFDLREYAAAYSDYSQSLELDPNQSAALFNRSLAAEHLGRFADAAKDRRLAHELDASIGAGATAGKRSAASAGLRVEYASPRSNAEEPRVEFSTPRTAPAAASAQDSQGASQPQPVPEVTVNGYRRVVVNGQERFCQSQQALGSHVEKSTVCYTRQELEAQSEKSRNFVQQIQRSGAVGQQIPHEMGGATH